MVASAASTPAAKRIRAVVTVLSFKFMGITTVGFPRLIGADPRGWRVNGFQMERVLRDHSLTSHLPTPAFAPEMVSSPDLDDPLH